MTEPPKEGHTRLLTASDDPFGPPVGWQLPFLDVLLALVRSVRVVLLILVISVLVAAYELTLIVPEYSATSVSLVLPRDKASFDASIETGSLETSEARPRAGSALPFTLPPNVDLYVLLMKSSSTLDRVANTFAEDLVVFEDMPRDHRSTERASFVRRMVTITGNDDGMISVIAKSKNAKLAADIANAFVNASDVDSRAIERKLLSDQATILAESAKAASVQLKEVRENYFEFTKKHSLLDPELHAAGVVDEVQYFKSEVSKVEADVSAALTRFREGSPEILELRARLAELIARRDSVETNLLEGVGTSDFSRIAVEYRSLRQLLEFRQDLVLILSSQAEIYKIRAEQATGPVVVVRPATVPRVPSGPSKKKIVVVPLFLGVLLAFAYAIVREQSKAIWRSPQLTERANAISRELRNALPERIRHWRKSA